MTICAIKICRNYKGRLKTTKKVTYHRIPNDPDLRKRWIDIIRKSRGEDLWHPSKTTVICSDHFHDKDMYFISNEQKRRRLKKAAIPCKAVFITSLESDDDNRSEDFVEDTAQIGDCEDPLKEVKKEESDHDEEVSFNGTIDGHKDNVSRMETSDNMSSNITCKACGSTRSVMSEQASNSVNVDERRKEKDSDLDSVYDTPLVSKMRKRLRRKIHLEKIHSRKIESLTRENCRLLKKKASLKQIITKLKKREKDRQLKT